MRTKKRIIFLALILFSIFIISSCAQQDAITQSSTFSTADFAKCLSDKGAKAYGAWWCEHCDAQKELFGAAWGSINYIECGVQGNKDEQAQICIDNGIKGYPTWEFKDSSRVEGKKGFLELSQLSGCPVPSGPTQPSQENIVFLGPQQTLQSTINQEFSYSFCQPKNAISGATCGALAEDTIDPTSGKPPYSFSISASGGRLPPGLRLNLNGLLEGTPTLEGVYNFGVCAKDLSGNEDCKEIIFIANKKDQPIVSPESQKDTAIEDPAKPKEESMTYQVDFDSYFTHNDDYSHSTEHILLSAQKTITRKSPRDSFEGEDGEQTPVQVSVEGYKDVSCMKDGVTYNTVRGTFSAGPYDGTVDIDLRYKGEEVNDISDQGLWVSFSQINGLPKLPPAKRLGNCPTAASITEQSLSLSVNDLYEATYSVRNRLDEKAHPGESSGPIFKSIDGGAIDFSGTEDGGYNKYKWISILTVKRIS